MARLTAAEKAAAAANPASTGPGPAPAVVVTGQPAHAGYTPPIADGVAKAAAPLLSARPPFLLQVHSQRWGVIGGQVVPVCGTFKLQNGLGEVSQLTDGRFKIKAAKASAEERGWTLIPSDVDGPGTSYVYEAAPGVYLTRWERCFPGSNHIESDTKGYVAWLRKLVESGKIPAPEPYVIGRLMSRLEQEHADLIDKVGTHPSLKPRVEQLARDIAILQRELERVTPAPPAPKPVNPADLAANEDE
jgi:hypothetical protein